MLELQAQRINEIFNRGLHGLTRIFDVNLFCFLGLRLQVSFLKLAGIVSVHGNFFRPFGVFLKKKAVNGYHFV